MISNKHEEAQKRMYEILSHHPLSMTELKKEIGIAFYTLKSFIDGDKIRLQSLSKIEGWLNKKEKGNG